MVTEFGEAHRLIEASSRLPTLPLHGDKLENPHQSSESIGVS